MAKKRRKKDKPAIRPTKDLTDAELDKVAGGVAGTGLRPGVDDQVLVSFESGDARTPVVIGKLWGDS
jgi:hypothetical protein